MGKKICIISLLSISIIAALVIGGLSGVPPVESKPNGVIAFITDYGTKDFYVGAVKGVIYSIFPDARVVDITHEVTPFDVHEGAVTLWLAAREFRSGTVFVAVGFQAGISLATPLLLRICIYLAAAFTVASGIHYLLVVRQRYSQLESEL